MFGYIVHKKIYFWGLALLIASMPLSVFMMSVSQFILSGNWLLEGNFKNKFKILKSRKSIIVFMLIFFVHILGLIYTSDFNFAFRDIRIKLPMLILPLIIGTSNPISLKDIKKIVIFLSLSIFAGTIISLINFYGINQNEYLDSRKLSVFISHIRFSLLINVSIFSLIYFLIFEKQNWIKIVFLVLVIWFILYLFILQSLTGLVVLFLISLMYSIYRAFKSRNKYIRIVSVIIFLIISVSTILYINSSINKFYSINEISNIDFEAKTSNGNLYYHDTINKSIENGNRLYTYLCEEELKTEWNKKSIFGYDCYDKKGQEIKYTLIRYLTSKGLRKDGDAIISLVKNDINAIENGCTNYLFANGFSIDKKIYETVWEIDNYIKTGNPSGHSLAQRIEFLKTAFMIIKKNIFIGVGTGDLQLEFNREYELMNSKLSMEWRLRAHNQFVTFIIAFGVLGFLIILLSIIYPIIYEKKYKFFLFNMFFTIALLSMINEDTIETQAGVTFFALLYCLFVFGLEKKN